MDEKRTNATSEHEPDWFDLLQRQATLYERLTACAARQRAMIESDRVDPLLGLLAERKKITTELMGLSTDLAPVRTRWEPFCAELNEAERSRARGLMDRARGSLKQLLALDEEDARLLRAKKAATARSMAALRGGAGAMSAYRSAGPETHRLDAIHQES
jgi:hypothetical protein